MDQLTHQEIIEGLQAHAIYVSETVVRELLKKHGFVRRKALKKKRTGESPQRDEQFAKIARLKLFLEKEISLSWLF